jgi:ribose transport system ATP-binding protein
VSALIEMRDIHKRFGVVHALRGVDLSVGVGEVHALLGENGAGKSTLMKVLSGAVSPDTGDTLLGGAPYRPRGPSEAERRAVAMIYQERCLAPDLSVVSNVVLGHEHSAFGIVDIPRSKEVAERALARLGHAELSAVPRVSELGPGQRQVVELARALSRDARVIVMDEPTSSLSRTDAARLFDVVERLRAEGTSVIYISHFLEEVLKVADRYTVLRDGRTVATGSIASTTRAELLQQMAGRVLDEAATGAPPDLGEAVLELEAFRGARCRAANSLVIRRGEILGIFGLLGSGRTELLRAVFGLDPVISGRIRVAGAWDEGEKPRRRLEQGLGMLSEDRGAEGLALRMSIADNLTLSHLGKMSRFGWIDRKAQRTRAERWIGSLAIRGASPDAAVSSLSGGNQQKVALGRLLDLDLDVLLLDEPTRGVDAATRESIYRLLADLAARGKAVVLLSSYLPELFGACHRITVMNRGALCAARATTEWTEAEILEVATRGEAE